MGTMKKLRVHYKFFYIGLIFVLLYLWIPFVVGNVFSKRYCVNEHCFNRPSNYVFSYFLDNGKKIQSSFCFYTFSCKNNFQSKNLMNTILFNNIFNDILTVSIGNIRNKKYIEYMEKNIFSSSKKCQFQKKIDENQYIYYGYFIDDNRSFTLVSSSENVANDVFKDICN